MQFALYLAAILTAAVGSRGRHLSWPVFLAVGFLAIMAARG